MPALADWKSNDEGLKSLIKAIEMDDSDPYALANKGEALAALKRDEKNEEAIQCYDTALEKSPDNPIILTGKALLFARMGRNEEAEALNDESLGRNDNYANALVVRGLICYNMGKYDKALDILSCAVHKNPNDKNAWYYLGNVYSEKGKYDDAIRCLDSALDLAKKHNLRFAEAHNSKARALYSKDNYDEAMKEVRKAVEIKPTGRSS